MHGKRSYRTLHIKYILDSRERYCCFNVKQRWLLIISAFSKMALLNHPVYFILACKPKWLGVTIFCLSKTVV